MINVSRSLVRRFRTVARRAGLHKSSSNGSACVRLIAAADELRLLTTNGHVAIEYRLSGQFTPADITVPFPLFAESEAKSDEPVTIRLEDDSRVIVSWDDRGVPQERDCDLPATIPEMPASPSEWATNGPELLIALREAKATTDSGASRYALDSVQLQGAARTIVATDSRQLLLQSGFRFPFSHDLLMQATTVFSSGELPSDQPVEIGATADGVTVRVGDWTIFHELNKDGRYPNVDRTIPGPDAVVTRMKLDPSDAKFFINTVNRLPADDQVDRPLTLELNGEVVVRARKDEPSPLTELVLSRSQRIGNQLRLQTNRRFLTRALELGFNEVGFVDAQSPCVCRDATRTYVWMLLDPKDALVPNAMSRRIESASVAATTTDNSTTIARAEALKKPEVPVNRLNVRTPIRLSARKPKPTRVTTVDSHASTDLIEQALALRDQLRSLVAGLNDVISQIRQQRRHTRLMKSTLQSLKQLRLLEA